jgi:transcriptional antiterminator
MHFFENRNWLNKEQIASFFEVTPRTIDNYLNKYESELRHNGYEVLQGIRLKKLKKAIIEQFGDEMDFITKTTTLGIFDFRAFLVLKTETNGSSFHWAPSSYC